MTDESCERIVSRSGDPSPPRQTAEAWAEELERAIFRARRAKGVRAPRDPAPMALMIGRPLDVFLCLTVVIAMVLPILLILATAGWALGWLLG